MPTSDDVALLHYDGQLSDDEPQKMVVCSDSWLAFVRGAFEPLTRPESWDGDSDVDAAIVAARDIFAILLGVEPAGTTGMDYERTIIATVFDWTPGGGRTLAIDAAQILAFVLYPVTPGLNANAFFLDLYFEPGTYKLTLWGQQFTNCGRYQWYLDGDSIDPGGYQNWYNTGLTRNVFIDVDLTIVDAGLHALAYHCVGKDAASSGYYCILTMLGIRKTA